MEGITVGQLIADLEKFDKNTNVEVMVGFSCQIVRCVSGDDEEGVYLEIGE